MPDSPFASPLNWQINTGEVWGIEGSNGSGKSLIYVTHRKEEIPNCIDRFMILKQHETSSGE